MRPLRITWEKGENPIQTKSEKFFPSFTPRINLWVTSSLKTFNFRHFSLVVSLNAETKEGSYLIVAHVSERIIVRVGEAKVWCNDDVISFICRHQIQVILTTTVTMPGYVEPIQRLSIIMWVCVCVYLWSLSNQISIIINIMVGQPTKVQLQRSATVHNPMACSESMQSTCTYMYII